MDNLAAMQVFVRVIEAGGLSAAGRALNLAPSSVSRRISELEEMLGTRLLRRTTRKLSLTEAGETYFEKARDIVQAVEEANLAVTETRAEPVGTLRVAVPASVARRHLSPAVAAFRVQYPKVHLVMRVADRLVDIVEEGLDLAVRIGRLENSSLIARKLGVARRMICASPAYLEHAGRPDTPMELADHPCVIFRTHPGSNAWRFRKGEDITEVQVSGPFFADEGETLVAAACAGMGLIMVPEWLAGQEISDGRLVEILHGYTPEPADSPLHAVFAPGPYTTPKVRVFVDFLAERFSRNYAWAGKH